MNNLSKLSKWNGFSLKYICEHKEYRDALQKNKECDDIKTISYFSNEYYHCIDMLFISTYIIENHFKIEDKYDINRPFYLTTKKNRFDDYETSTKFLHAFFDMYRDNSKTSMMDISRVVGKNYVVY